MIVKVFYNHQIGGGA
jgi:hypothetical protein